MTTSIRIKNAQGQWATVWPLSEHFYSIQWDGDKTTQSITKQQLEVLKKHSVEVKEDKLKEITSSFKYYHIDEGPECVNTWNVNGITVGHKGDSYDWWGKEDAQSFIDRGIWIVVPNTPEKKSIGTLQLKIEIEGAEEAYKKLDEMVEQSNTLLESIKSFTSGTGHDVFVTEGIYKVYRKDEDMPYICYSDEQVVAVMDALITLDESGKEGDGRFFTLNIEGIL